MSLLGPAGYAADGRAVFSMSVNEFCKLSPADQHAILASAFEDRLQHAHNIHYEARITFGNYEHRDGRLGKKLSDGNVPVRSFRDWRFGHAYRVEHEFTASNETKQRHFLVAGFDHRAGVRTSTLRISDSERSFARISVNPSPLTEENRYAYWLDGKDGRHGEHLIPLLLKSKDRYTIKAPVDEDKVRITIPWKPILIDNPWGTREFILDPLKGFLPVRGTARWERKLPDGNLMWRTEDFTGETSQLVGGVWMPTRLKEWIGAGPHFDANIRNVYETEITRIESGTLTAKDVEIPFSPGMEVEDDIKGVTYEVGAKGEQTKVRRIVGAPAVTTLPAAKPR